MFEFLTHRSKDDPDPLRTSRTVSAWLRQLPALDAVGRQHRVMRVFDGMRQSRLPVDPGRVAAIEFLDTALATDRRQLMTFYVENVETSARSADQAWQAAHELSQGFVYAYQASLEQGLAELASPRWKGLLPQLFARLLHYHGIDAKLRAFRHEHWIPGKWTGIHQLYARACELGVERIAVALPSAGPAAMPWSPEQEYVYVLLVQQLNTGNLSPAEVDWLGARIRAWCRKLQLARLRGPADGFCVDLAGRRGLVRRTGAEAGPMIRYLDTTPLADQLEHAIRALRQAETGEPGSAGAANRQRVATLEKVRPVVAPSLHGDQRQAPRTPVTVAANVRVGLARICVEAAPSAAPLPANVDGDTEQIEVYAVSEGPRSRVRVPNQHDAMAASIGAFGDPAWQVKDRSAAGLRISASGGVGQNLELGTLVAVRQSDIADRVLGAVRRLNKISNDEVEAGVSILADRVIPVTVHAKRLAKDDDRGTAVNRVGASTKGTRIAALYLPPPSRPQKPLTVKTLIVPTSEYADGRNMTLATRRSVYTIALRQLVEQRAEWSWAAFQVVDKKPAQL